MRKFFGTIFLVAASMTLHAQTVMCCCCNGATGSGTVTSVAATVPSYMTIAGSPITTSGTLAFDFASQAQNLMFASPNGSSGVPLFRALVAADLPSTITSNTTGNAATATTATSAGTATSATTATTATALAANPSDCSSGQFANAIDASGNLTCGTPSGGGSSLPVADTTSIVEGSADGTKELRFEVDGFTTGTTRVATWPNEDITVSSINTAQTITAVKTFSVAPTAPVNHSSNQLFGSVTTPSDPRNLTALGSAISCGMANGSGGFTSNTVCIGDNVTATGVRRNTMAGSGAFSNANDCTRIGYAGGCTGAGSVAIGSGATVNGSGSMLFTTGGGGAGLSNTIANSVLFAGIDNSISNFTVGNGHTNAAPAAVTFRSTSGTGTNIAGAAFVVSAGTGTGTGKGGSFVAQTSPSTTSGTTAGTPVDRYRAEAKAVALTSGSTSTVFDMSLPSLGFAGANFSYTVFASDGTDVQTVSGIVNVSAVNKGGTITSAITSAGGGTADDTTASKSVSAGTLTTTWSVSPGTNAISVRLTPTTSLTATSFGVYYQILNNSPQTITPF